MAHPFLKAEGLLDHVFSYSPRGRSLRILNSERQLYDMNNLIFRNLDIRLETHWSLRKPFIWSSNPLWVKWHFEYCWFQSSSLNMETIAFGWRGNFRFHKNEFDFRNSREMRPWLVIFEDGIGVQMQGNDFKNNMVSIRYIASKEDSGVQELAWERMTAQFVKDSSYYADMIRKKYGLPETARLYMPHWKSRRPGLRNLSFLGNIGVSRLQLECHAETYDFRGVNCVDHLSFKELESDSQDGLDFDIYLGPREKIDPHFDNPLHHRHLFLTLRELASNRQDTRLASTLDKQIDRIDYFLTKEQEVSFRVDWKGWIEYWQDRLLYEWRRLSSDFYRSWLRPLTMFILGYVALNLLPILWIEQFTLHDWLSFSLRPINRMPFYTTELQEMFQPEYQSLSFESKNWLRLVGLIQVIWIALWGFAFSRSVKR